MSTNQKTIRSRGSRMERSICQTVPNHARSALSGVKRNRWRDKMYDDKLDKIISPPLPDIQAALAKETKSIEEINIMQPESSYPVNIGIGNQEDGTTLDTGSWMAKTCLVLQRVSQDGHPKETTTYNWVGGKPTTRYEEWLSCTSHGKWNLWKAKPMTGGEANEMEVRAGTKMDRVLGCIYNNYPQPSHNH